MERKKLIFFASADPRDNPRPARTAYHFASVAADNGLEAEVRLAGDAVRVATVEGIPDTALGDELREKIKKGIDAPFMISL